MILRKEPRKAPPCVGCSVERWKEDTTYSSTHVRHSGDCLGSSHARRQWGRSKRQLCLTSGCLCSPCRKRAHRERGRYPWSFRQHAEWSGGRSVGRSKGHEGIHGSGSAASRRVPGDTAWRLAAATRRHADSAGHGPDAARCTAEHVRRPPATGVPPATPSAPMTQPSLPPLNGAPNRGRLVE